MAVDPANVQAAAGAAPHIDPATVMGAAAVAQSPAEAAGNAQATAQYGTATTMASSLSGMSVKQQTTLWNAQTPSVQSQLKAAGYKPPGDIREMGKPGRGIFGDIGAGLSSAWHAATSFEAPGIRASAGVLGKGLNLLGKGLGQTKHIVRVAEYENDLQNGNNWGNPFAAHGPLNLQSWKQGWDQTNDAPKDFVPSELRAIQAKADPQQFALAKKLASGTTEQQIVQGTPAAQQQQVVQALQDPAVKSLVTQLQNAHMSLGRWAVGENVLNKDPVLGKILSGGIDAAFDWYGDPLNRPVTKLVTGLRDVTYGIDAQRAASFIVRDGTEADAINGGSGWSDYMAGRLANPSVSRAVQKAGDLLSSGQGNAFRATFSSTIGPLYDTLVADGVDSADGLRDWLSSQAGLKAILAGSAGRSASGVTLLPHLSPIGLARTGVRAALRTSLDNLIDNPHELSNIDVTKDSLINATGPLGAQANPENLEQVADQRGWFSAIGSALRAHPGQLGSKVARVTRNLGTLVPTGEGVDLSDPASFDQVRKALLYSLPVRTVDQIGAFYVHAGTDERYQIIAAAKAQMLHYAGAFANGDSSQRIQELMQEGFKNEAYAGQGLDKMASGARQGLLETQMSTRVALPNLYDVHRAALADNFLQRMGIPEWVPGTKAWSTILRDIGGVAHNFMGYWRQSVLAREGFPLRIAIDENGNYLLRHGALPMIAARVALHSYKGDMKELAAARDASLAIERGMDPEVGRWARSAAIFAHAVPAPILNSVRSMKDLGTAVISENAWRVFKGTTGLSKEDFYKAGDIIATRWDVAGPAISAVHHAGGGYDEAEHLSNYLTGDMGKPIPLMWKKNGTFSDVGRDDPLFLAKYAKALDIYGSSKLARAAMETVDSHPDTQMRHVLSVLESDDPEMVKLRAASARDFRLPDGREVGVDPGVDTAAAHRAWARKIVAATNALVKGAGGTVHHDVIDEVLAKHGAPSMDTLKGIEDLPHGVFGPELVPVGKFQSLLGNFMNKLAIQMDVLARQPNYLHAVAQNMKEVEPMVRALQGDGEHADQLLGDLATQRGIADLKPFIHNPEMKTQFEVLHRTAAPFLFAQHQFLQRWGRTFAENPAAIREAQLLMNGLQTSGLIHQDSQGNWFFYYPGAGSATSTVAHILDHFGIKSSLPINIPFTGELRYIMPGISNPLTPSTGPFIAIPLKAIAQFDPAFQGIEQALLQQGAAQSYWEQVLPSTVSRVINGIVGDSNPGTTYASMMINAMQAAEATGNGLLDIARENGHVVNGTPVPTAQDEDQYLNRVKNWARINTFATALLGFAAPASPSQDFDVNGLSARFNELLNELPYNEAITEFLREHPDATPWTVAKSTTTGEEELPASQAAGNWLNANAAFTQDHPYAAGWFIPRTTGNAPYDPAVYREQIQYGLRSSKAPAQFLNDVAIAPAASVYYQVYDAKEAAIAANPNNSAFKQSINQRFDQWRGTYLAMNPLFASDLQGNTNGARRSNTIQDINAALEDPRLPDSPQATHVANVAAVYNAWEQQYVSTEGNTSTAAYDQGKALEARVIAWGNQYAQENADVSDLWTLVYLPEIRSITSGVAYAITPAATGTPNPTTPTSLYSGQEATTSPPLAIVNAPNP